MAATTSTNMILVISLLCSCLGTLHAQTILTLDMVYPPVGSPYTPEVSADNKYDISAGSNVSLTCSIPESIANLRYTTHDYAKFPRFDGDDRVRRADTGPNWTLLDLKHYDTGLLECHEAADARNSETIKSIYIFVSDPGGPLFVPMRVTEENVSVISFDRHDYVPCLPTHSLTTLTVTHFSRPVDSLIISNILGFVLTSKLIKPPHYECHFKNDSRADEISQWSFDTSNKDLPPHIDNPSPIVFPLDHISIYSPGDAVTINCTIKGFTTVQNISWSYPALACDNPALTDCQAPLDRVTKTEARKINGDRDVQSQLTITNLHESDSGNYTCMYKANGRSSFEKPDFTNISVYAPFANISQMSKVRKNTSLVFSVTLKALPAPITVEWRFNDQVMTTGNGSRYNETKRQNPLTIEYKVTLTISSVTQEDAGSYSLAVYVQNSTSDVRTIDLMFQDVITCSKWNRGVGKDISIPKGETLSLQCVTVLKSPLRVTWYKDNTEIEDNSDGRVLSGDSFNLTINKVTKEHAGSYYCAGETICNTTIYSNFTVTVKDIAEISPPMTSKFMMAISLSITVGLVIVVLLSVCVVRRYYRKTYIPRRTTWLPSKDLINPDIPLEQISDALLHEISWEFPIENLKLGILLGQGAFGRVLKAEAMHIEEGVTLTTVAVKTVRDHSNMEQVKALISELKILIHVGQHLNIVNLLGACTKDISKGPILVIVEFCRYGNLRSYLLKHKSNFNPTFDSADGENTAGVKLGQAGQAGMTDDDDYLNDRPSELHSADEPVSLRDITSWSYQLARGMEYLASIDYIHRDLAARNVLLADNNIVKICDFGLAKDVYNYPEYQKQTDCTLPIKWMALESLTQKVFAVSTDVWSYGVTVWELFSLGTIPYPGWEINHTFIDKLKEGYRMDIPEYCPENIYKVMLHCWHPDPENRPNFAELAEMMGELVDQQMKMRLQSLEDPYLRCRDSRTDITIRSSCVRNRDSRDFRSDYLPTKLYQCYTNRMDTQSGKASEMEATFAEEKMALHVDIDSDEDVEIPSIAAPTYLP